jgi:hypothetical protein
MCILHFRKFDYGDVLPYKITFCAEYTNVPSEERGGDNGATCSSHTFLVDEQRDEHCERCTREGLGRTREEGFPFWEICRCQTISRSIMNSL